MDGNHKEFQRILEILKENPRGMSLKQISEAIGMNRISVARYLDILRTSGKVDMVPYGQAKLFYLSHRVPVSALMDFSSDFVVVLGKDQKIVQVNKNFLGLFTLDRDEILDQPLLEVLYPLSQDLNLDMKIDQVIEGKELVEEICILKDDEELFFQMKIVPTVFTDGSPGTTIILEDITEYKRSLDALIESERKFRSLVENLSDLLTHVEEYSKLNKNIRDPLQVMVGFADLQGGELSEKIHQQAKEIDSIIKELDIGLLESANIRKFLRKHYIVPEPTAE